MLAVTFDASGEWAASVVSLNCATGTKQLEITDLVIVIKVRKL